MEAVIDTRFLKVHPRTALWWQQREQCQRCACMSNGAGMRCSEARTEGQSKWSLNRRKQDGEKAYRGARVPLEEGAYCISARDEGSVCGPDAKLFKAAS